MISLNVNGATRSVDVDADTPLLYVLRDTLGLTGCKYGCGLGQCGACAVLVDGKVRLSCITPVGTVSGTKVVTVEGLGTSGHLHPIQAAFIAEQAAQCGYCTAGMVITATALLDRQPRPSEADIRAAFAGNLCRCGAHPRIIRAVQRAAGTLSG